MRWLRSRRAEDATGAEDATNSELLEETPAEPMQPATVDDEIEVTEPRTDGNEVTEPCTDNDQPDHDGERTSARHRITWSRAIAYGVLPGVAFLLASGAGYLKWQDATVRQAQASRAESIQAATDGTIALLSYRPETVDKDLEAAKSRLTGTFLTAYTQLTHDVVIPGAKQKQISAVATVPASSSTSATATHAVVLLYVNQTVIVGQDAPTNTASSVRVTLDKVGGRWLISQFDPV